MLVKMFFSIISLSPTLEEKLWKWWYQRLAKLYPQDDWRFMNYGYAPPTTEPALVLKNPQDEQNRLFIQLYHHVLSGVNLGGKKVLEVGSGRGGGCDFVARYLAPDTLTGVDFAKNAVDLSNQFNQMPNLHFVEGSAEKLPFENNSFDVVYNIESSHCYGNMQAFVDEVIRVLKPGGIFAWADLRTPKEMGNEEKLFLSSPLKLISKEEITANVVEALNQISNYKKEAIQKNVPILWRAFFSEFAAVKDTRMYHTLRKREMVYWCYHLQKPA